MTGPRYENSRRGIQSRSPERASEQGQTLLPQGLLSFPFTHFMSRAAGHHPSCWWPWRPFPGQWEQLCGWFSGQGCQVVNKHDTGQSVSSLARADGHTPARLHGHRRAWQTGLPAYSVGSVRLNDQVLNAAKCSVLVSVLECDVRSLVPLQGRQPHPRPTLPALLGGNSRLPTGRNLGAAPGPRAQKPPPGHCHTLSSAESGCLVCE